MDAGPWNWLEVVKLIAGALTPIALAVFGIYVHRVTKRFELLQWRSQKLIEKRLAVYDDLAPHLNDLMCYFTYVGCWKELDPPTVVALKRTVDKKIHLAAPMFSKSFFGSCMNFKICALKLMLAGGAMRCCERNSSVDSKLAQTIGSLNGTIALAKRLLTQRQSGVRMPT